MRYLSLGAKSDGTPNSVLDFLREQAGACRFKYLLRVAKIVFALPASAEQIERDFEDCQLAANSLLFRSNDSVLMMSSFIKSNRAFVDVVTCPVLEIDEAADISTSLIFSDKADEATNGNDGNRLYDLSAYHAY
jgi:hypothetical protein